MQITFLLLSFDKAPVKEAQGLKRTFHIKRERKQQNNFFIKEAMKFQQIHILITNGIQVFSNPCNSYK